jgi:hypothetical protein
VGKRMEATMAITFDPGAPPATVFDKGPLADLARHFAAVPGSRSLQPTIATCSGGTGDRSSTAAA